MISTALAMAAALFAQDAAFSFKQLTTALTAQEARSARIVERCSAQRVGGVAVQLCSGARAFWEGGIAGLDMYGAEIVFDDAGFIAMNIGIDGPGYSTAAAAFRSRYGEPCDRSESVLQNRFGAEFQQETLAWCFSDGKLMLSRYSPRNVDRAAVSFMADRIADKEPETPPINF